MEPQLKRLYEQVMLITGATSGIGLVTARQAAERGARLVLVSRSESALRELAAELRASGREAIYAVADVAAEPELRQAAELARSRFGRIDTWVNNAGVSIYGKLLDVPIPDQRRLFETNFWGMVHGSLLAVECLRDGGGALINMGSVLCDRAMPLQAMYCASKHAIKAFTDALRMELEEDGLPISVTLIKPGAIDTPYAEHARNYLPMEPRNPPPIYAPDVVAQAVLHAAEHPQRDIVVGGGGRAFSAIGNLAPRLVDRVMELSMFEMQQSDQPAAEHRDGIEGPTSELRERGGYPGHVCESSLYTQAAMHPLLSGALAVSAGLYAWLRHRPARSN